MRGRGISRAGLMQLDFNLFSRLYCRTVSYSFVTTPQGCIIFTVRLSLMGIGRSCLINILPCEDRTSLEGYVTLSVRLYGVTMACSLCVCLSSYVHSPFCLLSDFVLRSYFRRFSIAEKFLFIGVGYALFLVGLRRFSGGFAGRLGVWRRFSQR